MAMLRTVCAVGLASLALAGGCEVQRPKLFDAQSLQQAKTVVVLPLADAPGRDAGRSGMAVSGVCLTELNALGRYDFVNVTAESLRQAAAKAGLDVADCYDPQAAAELARGFGADLALTGEVTHFGTQQEIEGSTVLSAFSQANTKTTHLVSLDLRLVRASDGKVVYWGTGWAEKPDSFTEASQDACDQTLLALKDLLKRGK